MIEKLVYKILKLIGENTDIFFTLGNEYTYSQIGETFLYMANNEYIQYLEEKYVITAKGEEYLDNFQTYQKIEAIETERVIPELCLTIDEIYIPKYNKGGFGEIKNQ